MKICEFGADAKAQKECEDYEESKTEYCFKFRELQGLNHCNGLEDRTKEEE